MAQMKYGNVPGIEKPISRLVQGIIQVKSNDEDAGFALLDAAYERGINTIDTARIYGDKDAFLGKWIASRGLRDKVVVLAKGSHHSFRKRVTPWDIATDLHDTLGLMKTDYIDLYVLHRDDPEFPVEQIVDELNKWTRAGKIKAFGGSNWSIERIEAANKYAKESGQTPFAVSSPNFTLAEQVKEPWDGCVTISGPKNAETRQWYADQKIPLFTWSSMAGGFMSGRITPENMNEQKDGLYKLAVECYAYPQNFERLDRARAIGEKKGLTLPQVALAYVMNYPLDIFALVGSEKPEEIDANVEALNVTLTSQEMAYLDLRADSAA